MFINKLNQYIYYPDLANKFLLSTVYNTIPSKHIKITFTTIFTNLTAYSALPIKLLIMTESIYPIRCQSHSTIIRIRFGKTRVHSSVSLSLTFNEGLTFLIYNLKKPSYTNNLRYFTHPGFINLLSFPSNRRNVLIDHNKTYLADFTKSAFLE